MTDKTFKVGDRVKHKQLERMGEITYIYTQPIEGVLDEMVDICRVQFDDFPGTIDAREYELEWADK